MTEPKTISIEPDYAGMRAWLRNLARTDLTSALNVNETLGSEGIDADELRELAGPIEERSDERVNCLADILITAVEDGCLNSWRTVSGYKWDTDPDEGTIEHRSETRVTVHEFDELDDNKETVYAVGIETIEKGLKLIAEGAEGCGCNSEITGACAKALACNDPDEFDAYSADAVMQAGMFGEVVYG